MNRRTFLTTSSAALAGAATTACGGKRTTLHVYTWADYIDPELVRSFEAEQSCRVRIDTFDSNEAMYAKLAAGASGYDILVPSSYMIRTLARENRLFQLDHAKLPNLTHIDPDYLKTALDPKMTHSVPYLVSSSCLAWLGERVANAEPSYTMFERADLKGRSTLLDDMREVLGAALLTLGHSVNSKDPAQLAAARDLARRWKANIAKFDSEQYKNGIASGEFHLVQGYISDLLQVSDETDGVVVKIPREGAPFSCDDLCIPKDSVSVDLAHRFINFFCDPEHSAQNMEWVGARAPNASAFKLLSEDIRGNELLFPPEEVAARLETIDDLGDALALWSKTWDEVKA